MDIEAMATTGFLSFLTNATIGRERPYVRLCDGKKGPPDFPSCKSSGQNYSFFSGHTGIAFTAAALTCSHHARMALYGLWALDALGCVATMGAAATTGVLRIMADKHYATDVITGVVLGLTSGFGVSALHYRSGNDARAASGRTTARARMMPAPMLSPTTAGLSITGFF
jgi:membrane-associated phospholipid phosphatase